MHSNSIVSRRTSDPIQFQAIPHNQRNNTQNPVRLHLNRILYIHFIKESYILFLFLQSFALVFRSSFRQGHASTLIDLKISYPKTQPTKAKQKCRNMFNVAIALNKLTDFTRSCTQNSETNVEQILKIIITSSMQWKHNNFPMIKPHSSHWVGD